MTPEKAAELAANEILDHLSSEYRVGSLRVKHEVARWSTVTRIYGPRGVILLTFKGGTGWVQADAKGKRVIGNSLDLERFLRAWLTEHLDPLERLARLAKPDTPLATTVTWESF